MKHIKVVAAIITEDQRFLATQRGHGEFKGLWEFPGGKIEEGESPEEALTREIREELDVLLKNLAFLCRVEHTYPSFHLTLDCYLSEIKEGTIRLTEHTSKAWLTLEELDDVTWLPADIDVVKAIRRHYQDQTT